VAERWDVPYEPGVLRAVGKRNGTVAVTTEVRTAGSPARLRLSVDRDTIRSGIRDVAHVKIEVVDRNGVVVPSANAMIDVAVDGPATVLAVGNGDPADHASYGPPRRNAYHGLALAMIQSTDATGRVRVTVRAQNLPAATVDIVVAPGEPLPRLPTR
jgi:beta-galactosidase